MNMTSIIPNPNFTPTAGQKLQFQAIKELGEISNIPITTAMENVKNSGGMYMIKPAAEEQAIKPLAFEDMGNDELKVYLLRLGIEPQKQMRRAEIIKAIRLKMDAVEIIADE